MRIIGLVLVLLTFSLWPSGARSEKLYADELFAIVQSQQDRIDRMQEGLRKTGEFVGLDDLEQVAQETRDPEYFIMLNLARFHRMLAIFNFAMQDIASATADFIADHSGDGTLSPIVYAEGEAKYRDMADFCYEAGWNFRSDFIHEWYEYSAKYGDEMYQIFETDNDWLIAFGVEERFLAE